MISVGRSGHRYYKTRIRGRRARITPGAHPVGALRLPMRLRELPGRFSALARITRFFCGDADHGPRLQGALPIGARNEETIMQSCVRHKKGSLLSPWAAP